MLPPHAVGRLARAPAPTIQLPFCLYTHSKPKTISNADSAALESCSAAPLVEISPGTLGTSPGEVVLVVCPVGGCGPGTVGMSPASAGAERTHIKANADRNRFMDLSPFEIGDARTLTSDENRATSGSSCKRALRQLISGSQLHAL